MKEITEYFENITKQNNNKIINDRCNINYQSESNNIFCNKLTINCRKTQENNMINKIDQNEIYKNIWKDNILYGNILQFKKSSGYKSNDNGLNSIRDSLKSSFITCMLLLQYIM